MEMNLEKFDIKIYCKIGYPLLEKFYHEINPPKSTGRPRKSLEKIFYTIMFILKTGTQWDSIKETDEFVNGKTSNRVQNILNRHGILEKVYAAVSVIYEREIGFDINWQSVDCTKVQAPVRAVSIGKEDTGANPTDRGFKGTKISMLCDHWGMPMSYCITGANVHDSRMLRKTLENGRLFSLFDVNTRKQIMNLCLDKGYDGNASEECAYEFGYIDHIRTRGEEIAEKKEGYSPKRWVAERSFAWLKGFHYIRTRYTQKARNFNGLVGLAISTMHVRRLLRVMTSEELVAKMLSFDWDSYFNWVAERRSAA